MSELIFLAVIAVLALLGYNEVLGYTVTRFDRTGGPAIYPKLLLILLLVALVIRAVQILMSKDREKFKWASLFKGQRGIFFLAFVAFVALMKPLGFIVDGTLFLTFTSLYLYYRSTGDKSLGGKKKVIFRVIFSLAFCTAVYLFFANFLHVAVPEGILGFIF